MRRTRVGMDGEHLLRPRVRGIIAAAEGRADHLRADARRDAVETRRAAALEALETVTEVERELRMALRHLSATAERLAAALDPEPGEERRPRLVDRAAERRHRAGFVRASMRERPVAALFAAAAESG